MSVVLMNGTREARTKATEGVTFVTDTGKPDGVRCGCAHLEREWIQLCTGEGTPRHFDEWRERHEAARIEHQPPPPGDQS